MARTTRSAVAQNDKSSVEKDRPSPSSPPSNRSKQLNKKRKRHSNADTEDVPNAKVARPDGEVAGSSVKEEDLDNQQFPPFVGDLPLKNDDAQKILDILEMADTIGLLDRVFPLNDDVLGARFSSVASSSKNTSNTFSLRALLKSSHEHPLRVLRSAVNQLFPISSHPRSRSSSTAVQQLRFCQLALSLLDQASTHMIDGLQLPPDLLLPDKPIDDDVQLPIKIESDVIKREKYALVQKLPSGDWWTSLNSDPHGADTNVLKDLPTGYAELVSILPSPPPPVSSSTLGDFFIGKKVITKAKLPQARRVSCGTFLDYGVFSSFAPTFDSEGAVIGSFDLRNMLWHKQERARTRSKAKILRNRLLQKMDSKQNSSMDIDIVVEPPNEESDKDAEREEQREKQKELLEAIFDSDEAENVMLSLEKMELESGVYDLLERNAKALLRLEELQRRRIGGENGGSSTVEPGSEEDDLAHKILDSLAIIASLRPRLSSASKSAILPSATVLRTLSQSLPAESSHGWYGTLSESQSTALRDDSTMQVKAGVVTQIAAPAPTSTPSTPFSAVPTPPSFPQSSYAYSNYAHQYRSAYPYGAPQMSNAAQAQPAGAQTSYPSSYPSTSQSYAYNNWYQTFQPVAAGTASGTTSGRGTPQPTPGPTANFANYSTSAPLTAPTPARVVANTIAGKVQPNGWSPAGGAANYVTPTLPLHLRSGVAPSPNNARTPISAPTTGFGPG